MAPDDLWTMIYWSDATFINGISGSKNQSNLKKIKQGIP